MLGSRILEVVGFKGVLGRFEFQGVPLKVALRVCKGSTSDLNGLKTQNCPP